LRQIARHQARRRAGERGKRKREESNPNGKVKKLAIECQELCHRNNGIEYCF